MGTLTKTLTIDCIDCGYLEPSEDKKLICKWGKTKKGKLLLPKKGKATIKCKLIEKVNPGVL